MAFVVYDPVEVQRAIVAERLRRYRAAKFALAQPTVWCARCDAEATMVGTWRDEEYAATFFAVECHGELENVQVADLEVQSALCPRPPLAFVKSGEVT